MDKSEFQYWVEVNDRIGEEYPDLQVTMTNFNEDEANDAWVKSSQIGEAFDIILLDNHLVREFAVQGYLLPADDIYARDSLEDQLKALTDPLRWNGSIWGIPADSDPMIIAWSRELLRDTLQEPPATWESFIDLVNELRLSNPSLKGVNVLPNDAKQMTGWLGSFKGSIEAAANLSNFNDAMKHQIQYTLTEASTLDPENQMYELIREVKNGNIFSVVMPWSQYKRISREEPHLLSVGFATAPIAWNGGRSFVVTSESSQLQRARQWINMMTSSSRQMERYTEIGKLPARNSVYAKQYASEPIVSRPPNWMVEPLQKPVYIPDPRWSERWNSWVNLWHSPKLALTELEQAEYIIREWNGAGGK
nr:extracellular solute-binding protein [Paenibacillus oenotherae]